MSQYEEMSLVYDQLTQDQPYHLWFDIVQYYAHNHPDILDIGGMSTRSHDDNTLLIVIPWHPIKL